MKVISLLTLFTFLLSNALYANSEESYLGSCTKGELEFQIFYTDLLNQDSHVVRVLMKSRDVEIAELEVPAVGWQSLNKKDYFVVGNIFSMALLQGESDENFVFPVGGQAEEIRCSVDLTPVLKDYPKSNFKH